MQALRRSALPRGLFAASGWFRELLLISNVGYMIHDTIRDVNNYYSRKEKKFGSLYFFVVIDVSR